MDQITCHHYTKDFMYTYILAQSEEHEKTLSVNSDQNCEKLTDQKNFPL